MVEILVELNLDVDLLVIVFLIFYFLVEKILIEIVIEKLGNYVVLLLIGVS